MGQENGENNIKAEEEGWARDRELKGSGDGKRTSEMSQTTAGLDKVSVDIPKRDRHTPTVSHAVPEATRDGGSSTFSFSLSMSSLSLSLSLFLSHSLLLTPSISFKLTHSYSVIHPRLIPLIYPPPSLSVTRTHTLRYKALIKVTLNITLKVTFLELHQKQNCNQNIVSLQE